MDNSSAAPSLLAAAVQLPVFIYAYPPGFPRAFEKDMETALFRANRDFADEWLAAKQFEEIQAVRENWFWRMIKAYEEKLRQVAAMTLHEREIELRRFAEAAAVVVRLTRPRRERLFASEEWRALVASVCTPALPPNAPPAAEPAAAEGEPSTGALHDQPVANVAPDAKKGAAPEPPPALSPVKRTRRELTADEIDDLLGGKNAVSWDTAAQVLQRGKRQLRNLVTQGRLIKTSDGKGITTESIRKLLGPREDHKSEAQGGRVLIRRF